MITRLLTCLAAVLLVSAASGLAQRLVPEGKDAVLKILRTADFEVKADTAHRVWQQAAWTYLSRRGQQGVTYETKVKLLYSDKGIYALFWCEDKKITATLTRLHADIYREDVVEIFFWTDEKYPLYFEYELSPLDTELVLLVPNFNGKFLGWIPWHYEGERLTRHKAVIIKSGDMVQGWVAEFFIPFALLEPLNFVPPKKGTQWRMNMYRIDYDQGSTGWWWQPVKTNFHDIDRFGTLLFD